jgi:hypothetical protein
MCGLNLNTGMTCARLLTVHSLNIYKNVKGVSQKPDDKPTHPPPGKTFNFHSQASYILGNITLKMSEFCVFTMYYADKTKHAPMN